MQKNNTQNKNNAAVETKMKVYLYILSHKEWCLCEFDLKKLIFKKFINNNYT